MLIMMEKCCPTFLHQHSSPLIAFLNMRENRHSFHAKQRSHNLSAFKVRLRTHRQIRNNSAAVDPLRRHSRPLRIFISTGDVMGDMHGASLTEEILKQAQMDGNSVTVHALGGHRMKAAGAILIGDNTGLSSIGFIEALPLVFPSLYQQIAVRYFLQKCPPDIVVLIDYPGVNIPFGRYIKTQFGCKIIYYIPPNEWLWTTIRTHTIVGISDLILSVYQDESLYYQSAGANVINVGHPLIDNFNHMSYQEAKAKLRVEEDEIVVALIPASRDQEVRHVWPLMVAITKHLCNASGSLKRSLRFFVPVVLPKQSKVLKESLQQYGLLMHVQLWSGDPHVVMAAADLAITKSGSVNLELALHNVPQVVVYRIDGISAWIAKRLFSFSIKFVSLVNIILGYQLVPEFVQEEARVEKIVEAIMKLLPLPNNIIERKKVLEGYNKLRQVLGKPRVATRVAKLVLETIYNSNKL